MSEDTAEPHVVHIEGRELPDEDVVVAPPERVLDRRSELVYLVVGLGLFVTALGFMKAGADELVPTLEGSIFTDNAWSTLGLGWLGACLVLSGSPVAASALTLLDGGAIDRDAVVHDAHRIAARRRVRRPRRRRRSTRSATRQRRPAGADLDRDPVAADDDRSSTCPGAIIGYVLLDARRVRRPRHRHVAVAHVGHRHAVRLGRRPRQGRSCRAGRCSRSGSSCCSLGFAMFDKVLPTSAASSSSTAPSAWYDRKWPMFLARLRRVPAHAVGVGRAHRARAARGQGLPAASEHASLHRRRQHHDARRHARRGDPARQPGRRARRRRSHALGHRVDALPADVLLSAPAAGLPRRGELDPRLTSATRRVRPDPLRRSDRARSPCDGESLGLPQRGA